MSFKRYGQSFSVKRQVDDWQSVLEEIFARPLRTYGISDKLVRPFKRILTTSMSIPEETTVCGNLFIASEKWESTNDCLFSWIASVLYYFLLTNQAVHLLFVIHRCLFSIRESISHAVWSRFFFLFESFAIMNMCHVLVLILTPSYSAYVVMYFKFEDIIWRLFETISFYRSSKIWCT